jgi:hypothetical protein
MATHAFIATVGLVYSVISPLVLVVVLIYFVLYYLVYVYMMQYVYVHPYQTGGKFMYTSASQLFVGLIILRKLLIPNSG